MNESNNAYTAKVFDEYERRFAEARAKRTLRDPSDASDRTDILRDARKMLGFDVISAPKIKIIDSNEEIIEGFRVRHMLFCSWEHAYGEATLILPEKCQGRLPTVVICNGHSAAGRAGKYYQKLGFRFAACGMAVLLSDNLGQGSRTSFGHMDVIAPFFCGATLQGMIVAESCAWIEWLAEQPFVDPAAIGACGNSGGGVLTMFLTATSPRLAAAAACGYPSEFSYVLQKEKKHCCCNLLTGCAKLGDMWEICGAFAPKPLLIVSGQWDELFPPDVVRRTFRKIRSAYVSANAEQSFERRVTPTKHSLEDIDLDIICAFFCKSFGLEYVEDRVSENQCIGEVCHFSYPDDAISTNQLCEQLFDVKVEADAKLEQIFIPKYQNAPVDVSRIDNRFFGCNTMRILSQMELALTIVER